MIAFHPRPAQAQILEYSGGKMAISAVPGAGKTHTLSALAAKLILTGSLQDDQEILVVTLVNSSVDNFSSRIKQFLPSPMPFGFRVRTLHGLAHDIVLEKPGAVGLDERFTILDERETELIRKDAVLTWLSEHSSTLDRYIIESLDDSKRKWVFRDQLPEVVNGICVAFIRTAKDRRLTPAQLEAYIQQTPSQLPLAEMGLAVYRDYQQALSYRGAVDFDDLIRLSIDLLDTDPSFLDRLQHRWPYILEDEAQDSSRLQEQVLRMLAGKEGNWVRVGDPNQAIYETFTTADPQHLHNFIHSEADQYRELPDSSRSQPGIIALANQLITWVNNAHPEVEARNALTVPFIRPVPADDPLPNPPQDLKAIKLVHRKMTPEQEVKAVIESINRWMPGHPDSTVAVLVPRNARGTDVVQALKQTGIEFVELLGSTYSTRLTASRLADVTGILADPQSPARLAKAYLAWSLVEGQEKNSEFQIRTAGMISNCRMVESYVTPAGRQDWLEEISSEAGPEVAVELNKFRDQIRRWQSAVFLPIDQLILALAQDLFTSIIDLAAAHRLAQVLRQINEDHPDWGLPEMIAEIVLIAHNERKFLGFSEDDSGFDPSRHPGKVIVTTIHKAKGLEWDRVYLMSVNNYDFPSNHPSDRYIGEKWFLLGGLNLEAECLAQLDASVTSDEFHAYIEGTATASARLGYVRERLRLFFVGITRARRELVITWNTGRKGDQTPSIPFQHLIEWWQQFIGEK